MKSVVLVLHILFISSVTASANCFTEIKERIADDLTDKLSRVCLNEYDKKIDFSKFRNAYRDYLDTADFNWSVECSNQCETTETPNECSENFVQRHSKMAILAFRKRDELPATCNY